MPWKWFPLSKSRIVGLGLVLAFFQWSNLIALEPPTPEQLARYRRDGSLPGRLSAAFAVGNHLADPSLVRGAQQRLGRLLGFPTGGNELKSMPPGRKKIPTKGTLKVLALLIDFQDTPHNPADTPQFIAERLFGSGDPAEFPYESLRNFYLRSSYNQLDFQGNVLGWYTTPYPRHQVTQNTAGRENLIKEALDYYSQQSHDFTQYDNDGDGKLDYVMVFWSGERGEWASFWWGVEMSFNDQTYQVGGLKLGEFSWLWETSGLPNGTFIPKTIIHETGHALGLPDYYDYDPTAGPRGGVGGLDQMDGHWGDHNCFSKFLLDWITPVAYHAGEADLSLSPSADSTGAVLIAPQWSPQQPFSEFFMVQYRTRYGNDATFPAEGLLIWHVDATLDWFGSNFLYNNSYTEHKLLRLMEADGQETIEQGMGVDQGDFYIDSSSFGPATEPSSAFYYSGPIGLGIDHLAITKELARFDVFDVFADHSPPRGHPTQPWGRLNADSLTAIDFSWTPGDAADPESGIGAYYLRVGTYPGWWDKFDGYVINALQKTVSDCELGVFYYATVAAVNGNRLSGESSATSGGVALAQSKFSGAVVEMPTLSFTNTSPQAWYEETAVAHTGGSALCSGTIGDNAHSDLVASLDGPGELRFYWKVSSEAAYDFLVFSLNDQDVARLSGETGWARFTIPLPTGPNKLQWSYAKDESQAIGLDAGWIDDFTFRPLRGDLDLSGGVDSADFLILLGFCTGIFSPGVPPFSAGLGAADLNGDAFINSADLAILRHYLAGNLGPLGPE